MDWLSFLSAKAICLRYSLGDTFMIFMKKRLKLDTERKPMDSEMSRMESYVLRRSLQAFRILVLLTYSSGDMPMIS